MRSIEDTKRIKETYLPGMRIRLIEMDDVQAPPVGTMGTIIGIDSIGTVLVVWDTGSRLNIVLEKDKIEIIE